uniref:Fibronectin type-III domain-containing protein n=1 Tax=Ignavibacterium album TaxID=591197 RepID=A0A832G788_9BACT
MKFKVTSIFILLIHIIIFNYTFLTETKATIRYVSKTGSSTPPYTSWATAADSIQKCINISQAGDTIYVANGVYKEKIILFSGITLIGAGMDSCVIDTRTLISSVLDIAIYMNQSSTLMNFTVLVYYDSTKAYGIITNDSCKVKHNKIIRCGMAILCHKFIEVEDNFIYNSNTGIYLSNSSAIVKRNVIIGGSWCVDMNTPYTYYTPIIDSNFIDTYGSAISNSFGSKPTIRNNFIILRGRSSGGFSNGYADTTKVFNNVVISFDSLELAEGFHLTGIPHQVFNNTVFGKLKSAFVYTGTNSIIINLRNNISLLTKYGISNDGGGLVTAQYNNVWKCGVNYTGFTPDSTNLSVDPMLVNDDPTKGELDFHLQMFSPMIDAGDPSIADLDGTRSDIGLYGGPFGRRYIYQDLPPKAPVNLSATVDSGFIKLSWNRNTESDTSYYNVYRSTTANFNIDSTNLIASTKDTSFINTYIPIYERLYYKITCVDRQGNQSQPSEELLVNLTSISEYPTVVNDYYLYQNYPNPFNPSTKIGYKLKERGYVKLYVYDVKGEVVAVLVNQEQEAGYYEVEFNAGNGLQSVQQTVIASGIYIYQIMVRSSEGDIPVFTDSRKMIHIK